jgi:catechol 2,3-dioxygenase
MGRGRRARRQEEVGGIDRAPDARGFPSPPLLSPRDVNEHLNALAAFGSGRDAIAGLQGNSDIWDMDIANPSANPTFANRTPLHIGAVGLAVRDLDRTAAFYRDVIGLSELERRPGTVRLGAGGAPLVTLDHRPDMAPDDPRTAGLYHTAFLMPTRPDLALLLLHAARNRVPLTGASNHAVSEAIYLDDPEGNGVEVYVDRPPQAWQWDGREVKMITEQLDFDDLARAAGSDLSYESAPAGLRVGHIHLRVGDLDVAEGFYRDVIGLDVTRRRAGASFMSSAHYHHHVATNVWQSRGAGPRDPDRAGLAWFSFEANDANTLEATRARLRGAGVALTRDEAGFAAHDPWGTRLRFQTA